MSKRIATVQINNREPADYDEGRSEEFDHEESNSQMADEEELRHRKISKPKRFNREGTPASSVGSLFAGLPTNPFTPTASASSATAGFSDSVALNLRGLNQCFVESAKSLLNRNPSADFTKLFDQYRHHLVSFSKALEKQPTLITPSTLPTATTPLSLQKTENSSAAPQSSFAKLTEPAKPIEPFKFATEIKQVAVSPRKDPKAAFPVSEVGKIEPFESSRISFGAGNASEPLKFSFGSSEAPKFNFGSDAVKVAESIKLDEPVASNDPIETGGPFNGDEAVMAFSDSFNELPKLPFASSFEPPKFSFGSSATAEPPKFSFGSSIEPPKFSFGASATTPAAGTEPSFSFGSSAHKFSFGASAAKTEGKSTSISSLPPLPSFSLAPAGTASAGFTGFSFASPSTAASEAQGSGDEEGDGEVPAEEAESFRLTRTDSEALKTGVGEENETCQHEVRCKLFLMSRTEGWLDLGIGIIKVNRYTNESGRARLLCRAEGSGKILLNSLIMSPGTETTHLVGKKEVALLTMSSEGKPVKYLIRLKTLEQAQELQAALSAEIEYVKTNKN